MFFSTHWIRVFAWLNDWINDEETELVQVLCLHTPKWQTGGSRKCAAFTVVSLWSRLKAEIFLSHYALRVWDCQEGTLLVRTKNRKNMPLLDLWLVVCKNTVCTSTAPFQNNFCLISHILQMHRHAEHGRLVFCHFNAFEENRFRLIWRDLDSEWLLRDESPTMESDK